MNASEETTKTGADTTLRRWRSLPPAAVRRLAVWHYLGRTSCLSRDRRAFTLLELLVVISIIAVLGGIATPVTMSVINQAKVAKCRAQIAELSMAIEAYKMEYGHIPLRYRGGGRQSYTDDNIETNLSISTASNPATSPLPCPPWSATSQFLRCLMGLPNTDPSFEWKNEKGIKFFDPKLAQNGYGGLYEVDGEFAYNDPWGRGFTVLLDYNLNGYIRVDYRRGGWMWLHSASEPGWIIGYFDHIIMSKGKDPDKQPDNIYHY